MKPVKIIALVLVIAIVVGCVGFGIIKHSEISYVMAAMNKAVDTIKDGTWQDIIKGSGEEEGESQSEAPQLTFTPNNYAGVSLQSVEDVVNYFNTVYNATKAETANYTDGDGNTTVLYKMLSEENLTLKPDSLLIDGKPSSFLNGLVGPILGGIFHPNVTGMPPCANRDPNLDVDEAGASLMTSRVTPEDVLSCEVVDNGDGTITITIVPQTVNMSHKGVDAQGHFFNSLGAIDSTIDSIGVEWAEGTTADNCKVIYQDGYAKVKVDVASGKIVEGDYHMVVKVDITHANFKGVIKNKGAGLILYYDNKFPASDEYIMEKRQLVRQ